jgi:hypothetical protein
VRRALSLTAATAVAALLLAACSSAISTPSGNTGTTATPGSGAGEGTNSAAAAGTGALAGVHIPDAWSPITVVPIGDPTFPVLGTDGKYHVAYDLELTNASRLPATLDKLEVVDAHEPSKVITSFSGKQLIDPSCPYGNCNRLKVAPAGEATDATIAPSESRTVYVDFVVDTLAQAPKATLHHLFGTGSSGPAAKTPSPFDYLAAPFDTSGGTPRVIGPPVKGPNWVALNGCCEPGFPHRGSLLPVNGKLNNSQRFAIDWKQTNAQGEFVTGDKTKNESYVDYGVNIYAVADGTVVSILDGEEANAPGVLPVTDPVLAAKITLQNVDGNHIVLDLGGHVYAMYAHMIKGTLTVKPGDKVKKGDVIGKLGNTGNANASHMHFQLMNDPSLLEGDGLPYVIDTFTYRGQVDPELVINSNDYVTGEFFDAKTLPAGQTRTDQLPLNLAIVDFPTS